MAVLALAPLVGAAFGLSHASIGAVPPPTGALQLNASILVRHSYEDKAAKMLLAYTINGREYRHDTPVPQSYFDQMQEMVYAPITVPDPGRPEDIYIGPPISDPGITFWQLGQWDEFFDLCLLGIGALLGRKQMGEYLLLKFGRSAMGVVVKGGVRTGVILQIMTPKGAMSVQMPWPDPARHPKTGTHHALLYPPWNPRGMKLLAAFQFVELP